jgi:hypothetical protein
VDISKSVIRMVMAYLYFESKTNRGVVEIKHVIDVLWEQGIVIKRSKIEEHVKYFNLHKNQLKG